MKFLKETILANSFLFIGAGLLLCTNPIRSMAMFFLKIAARLANEDILVNSMKDAYEKALRARDAKAHSTKSTGLDQNSLRSTRDEDGAQLSERCTPLAIEERFMEFSLPEGEEGADPSGIRDAISRAQDSMRDFDGTLQEKETSSAERRGDSGL